MNTNVIGINVKKLRSEQEVTQQQLADTLSVSFQAVSKWENGTTAPDVGTIPEIADFFGVTIDDLFKPNMNAYRNRADRLTSLYESDISNSEVYEKANTEFKRLFDTEAIKLYDISKYAYLNDCRASYHLKIAEQHYLRVIELGNRLKDDTYYKNHRQYTLFLSRLGRADESINRYTTILENEPDNPMSYSSLVSAYTSAGDNEKALKFIEMGIIKFSNNPMLLTLAGDVCKSLKEFDKAITYWEKAYEVDPEMIDARYSIALYFIKQGYYDKAKEVLLEILRWNEKRGYEIENKWVRTELNKLEKS